MTRDFVCGEVGVISPDINYAALVRASGDDPVLGLKVASCEEDTLHPVLYAPIITNGMPAYFYDNTLLLNQLLVNGGKIVVYNMMILPLTICMFTANTLNLYVSKKTKSIWAGFFVALLFGTWMLISCGELTKMVY